MSKSNTTETDVLNLVFKGTALPWNANTDLYIALHTADPDEVGVQTTSEVSGAAKLTTRAVQLTTGAKPTCDATTRGTFWYVAGGTDVADTVEVCRKDGANAYAWVSLY